MKKSVLLLSLLGGAFISLFMLVMVNYCNSEHAITNMLITYTAMIISFLVIFVAIRKERDNQGGVITFGKAFRIGLLITFITSTIYVAAWMVDYYVFMPDFMDKYTAHVIQHLRESHLPPDQLKAAIAKANQDKATYSSPLGVIGFTYIEILPVGLLVSVIAALVLKRSGNKEQVVPA